MPPTSLPIAGTDTIGSVGGVKVDGSSITITEAGVISASSASGSKWTIDSSEENIYKLNGNVGIGVNQNINEKLLVNGNIKITDSYYLLTCNIITNTINAKSLSGAGSNVTHIDTNNITQGILPVQRGGTGKTILNDNQLIVGNGTSAPMQSPNLTWNNAESILVASNIVASTIAGVGSNITKLNAAYITHGTIDRERLPLATSGSVGVVRPGTNIDINATTGSISVNLINYKSDTTTIDGNLIVNSNLIVHGTETKLYTDVFTTERLELTNAGSTSSTFIVKQSAQGNNNNIINVSNYNSEVFNIKNNGNVGIGITNPANKLEVNGHINIPTGSTFRINNQPLNYTHLEGSAPASSKWTNATDGVNNIYYNLGNVGIGTISGITNKLEVDGSINISAGSKYKINGYNLAFSNIDGTLSYTSFTDKPDSQIVSGVDVPLTNEPTINPSVIVANAYYPRTPATNSATWTDSGYTVNVKVSDPVLGNQFVYFLFNNTITSQDHYHSQLSYTKTGNTYAGATRFKEYPGIAISVDFGRSIYPKGMRIAPRPLQGGYSGNDFINGAPKTFRIYASDDASCWNDNNHSSWTQIHDQTTSLSYVNEQYK